MKQNVHDFWELVLVAGTIIIFTLVNSLEVFTEWLKNKPGFVFTAIAHYYQDYFLYSTFVVQGIHGSWMYARNMYTNEPLPPTWYYWMYVLAGHLGSALTNNPFLIYNVFLLINSIVLLWIIYIVVRRIFPLRFPLTLGFLLAITVSNSIDIISFLQNGQLKLLGIVWFSPTPAFNRLGGVPHQMLQTILLLLAILLTSNALTKIKSNKPANLSTWLTYGALAFISFTESLTNPVQTLLLACSITLVTIVPIIIASFRNFQSGVRKLIAVIPTLLSVGLPFVCGAWLANKEVSGQIIFNGARLWESQQYVPSTFVDLIESIGPAILFLPFGILSFFKKPDPLRTIIGIYGMASLIAFYSPLPHLLGVANIRWLHPAAFIIFPLIATEGFMRLLKYGKRIHVPPSILASLLIAYYLIFTIPALFIQVNARTNTSINWFLGSPINHVPKEDADGLNSIYQSPGSGVVLTDPTLPYDIIVPPMTVKPSFTGHILHTLYPDDKNVLRQRFFSRSMTDKEAKQFVHDHRIGFVISTPQNAEIAIHYTFLTKIFENSAIITYTITQ